MSLLTNNGKEGHQPRVNPYLALVSGILAVSTGAIFARLADAPALVIAAYRVGLASLILAPIAWWKSRRELRYLSTKDLTSTVLAGLFLSLHFGTWITSLNYTSVANSVILVNTNPLWVGVLAPFVTGERIKPVIFWCILLSFVGAVIIGLGDATAESKAILGDFLALAGGMCASGYLLLGRNLRKKLSLIPYIFVCYGSAAIMLWAAVFALGLPITGFKPDTIKMFWAMALIPQLIGHTSYNWALKWFSTSLVSVSLLGEPIGSTILAYLIFAEGLTWHKIVGAVLILSAIFLAGNSEKPPASPAG